MPFKQFYKIFSTLFLLISLNGLSQKDLTKEKLFNILSKPQPDTTLIDTYAELCWPVYTYDNLDSAVYFGNKAIELSTKINDIKRLSIAHRRIGITYITFGNRKKALYHQEESYTLSKQINFKKGMQLALNNIGVIYLNNELYSEALSYFLHSLKIVEETKDYKSASNMLINCGIIYTNIQKDDKALEYFLKANENAKLQNDEYALIMSYSEISTIYRHKKQIDLAILFLDRAKEILKNYNNSYLNFYVRLNEAIIFSDKNNNLKALNIYKKLSPMVTNNTDKITLLINTGDIYVKLNKQDSALYIFQEGYKISSENKMYSNLAYITQEMAKIYAKKSDLKNYSWCMENHLAFRDSNEKFNKTQNILSQQLEFDFSRKQLADSITYEHKEKINEARVEALNAKSKVDKLVRIALITFLIIIVLVSFFIYSRLRLTKKQNKIIAEQKKIVEEKQKEILASINYAKRIQNALLPQEKYIDRKLNERKKS